MGAKVVWSCGENGEENHYMNISVHISKCMHTHVYIFVYEYDENATENAAKSKIKASQKSRKCGKIFECE